MATKQLYIYDDGSFIRVYNEIQNTTTYFNKYNLVVQEANNTTFFLKNDSNTAFYKYADVAYPVRATLDELIKLLVEWAKKSADDWDLSKADVIMNMTDPRYTNNMDVDEWATVNYVQANSANRINISGVFGNSTIQGKQYIQYKRGRDTLALINGNILEANGTNTNTIGKIGLYENAEELDYYQDPVTQAWIQYPIAGTAGVYFQAQINAVSTPVIMSVVLKRTNIADLIVPQTAWNIDKLDGTGPSGVNVNWQSLNTFVIEMKNQVGTKFKMGIMYGNTILFCHEFVDSAGASLTKDYEPSLPIQWQLQAVSTEGLPAYIGSQLQGTATVYSKQSANDDVRPFHISMDSPMFLDSATSISGGNPNNRRMLLYIQINPQNIRKTFKLTRLNLVNTSLGVAEWDLVYNTGSVLSSSIKQVSNSIMQYSDPANSYASGNTILASGFIYGNSIETIELDSFPRIFSDLIGWQNPVVLRVRVLMGTCNILASVDGNATYSQPMLITPSVA